MALQVQIFLQIVDDGHASGRSPDARPTHLQEDLRRRRRNQRTYEPSLQEKW